MIIGAWVVAGVALAGLYAWYATIVTRRNRVLIGGFPACRVGDSIQEVTSVNAVAVGCSTVLIGG